MEVIDNRKEGLASKISKVSLVKKLKGIKNFQLIAAIFIIAVALLIYSSVISSRESKARQSTVYETVEMDGEEERLSSILSGIDGAGRVQTMITRNDDEIVGIIVVAEGAEDISVRLKLLDATTTVMGVDKRVVNVYEMK